MKFRDIELLSSYLDGHLSPSESARLETRLSSDPNLRAAIDDLREARGLLRKLPVRKAPRNFTLTRQMVGLKPPLPRAYPTFRFATALATLLFIVTFAVNALGSSLTYSAAAPAPASESGGGGGPCQACGGGPAESLEAPAAEAPTEAPAMEAPAATEAPPSAPSLAVMPTPTPALTSDSARQSETPTSKETATESATLNAMPQQSVQSRAPAQTLIPILWQVGLAIVALMSGLVALLMRRAAAQKWK
jgi:hypothetical protein